MTLTPPRYLDTQLYEAYRKSGVTHPEIAEELAFAGMGPHQAATLVKLGSDMSPRPLGAHISEGKLSIDDALRFLRRDYPRVPLDVIA